MVLLRRDHHPTRQELVVLSSLLQQSRLHLNTNLETYGWVYRLNKWMYGPLTETPYAEEPC